jgi:MoxR-like ATPase
MTAPAPSLGPEQLAALTARSEAVVAAVNRVFIGAPRTARLLLVALYARGHVLLEGVPGVAKTTLAKTFATTLGCRFKRIQFTPDLLPADITGSYVLAPAEGRFELREGPVFANVVLGDEINRAPAKTQSALLEAMQETQTTIDGETRALPRPFIVLATQNPVEQSGTYPLPEAQIDRFLLRILIDYPDADGERAMLERFGARPPTVEAVLNPEMILHAQELLGAVHAESSLVDYIVRLTRFTRSHRHVYLGASPRASLALLQASKALALLQGRDHVLPDDIKELALPVLAHRIVLTPEAQMEDAHGEAVIREALASVGHRRVPGEA